MITRKRMWSFFRSFFVSSRWFFFDVRRAACHTLNSSEALAKYNEIIGHYLGIQSTFSHKFFCLLPVALANRPLVVNMKENNGEICCWSWKLFTSENFRLISTAFFSSSVYCFLLEAFIWGIVRTQFVDEISQPVFSVSSSAVAPERFRLWTGADNGSPKIFIDYLLLVRST